MAKVVPANAPSTPSYAVQQPPDPRKANYYLGCGAVTCVAVAAAALLPFGYVAYGAILVSFSLALAVALPAVLVLSLWFRTFLRDSDLYTKLLLLSYKVLFFGRKTPTAADLDPKKLKPKAKMKMFPIAYALNIAVPHGDEDDFLENTVSFTNNVAVAFEENLSRLPMTRVPARFRPGEDPVAYVMARLGDVYPPVRGDWSDKTSDDALTHFCLYGIGAHRVERSGDFFVVRTNALAALPVREGLERYGGDCYFDVATWRVAKIVRREPAGGDVRGATVDISYVPGNEKWEYVKFCFRSSLFSLVTLVDHLYGVHLAVGNVVVTASRECLGADHPLRRFLAPFSYQTISVNDNARNNLINPRSMGPRNFAFTEEGLQLAWAAAPSLVFGGPELAGDAGLDDGRLFAALFDRRVYVDRVTEKLGGSTPYWDQASEYHGIVKGFAKAYLDCYYATPDALLDDAQAMHFLGECVGQLTRPSAADLTKDPSTVLGALSAAATYDLLVNTVSRYCDIVTAGHEQVGTVPVYAQDVSFCSFRWPEGEMMGTKQTAITQATLMAFTSMPMPMLLCEPGSSGDWTHLFLDGPQKPTLDAHFAAFQAALAAFSAKCDAYDAAAADRPFPHCFGLSTFNPKYLETSVSV